MHEYELRAVPGLLQTEDYARAVIRAGQPRQTEAELERKVTARMERQSILTGDSPSHYWTVGPARGRCCGRTSAARPS